MTLGSSPFIARAHLSGCRPPAIHTADVFGADFRKVRRLLWAGDAHRESDPEALPEQMGLGDRAGAGLLPGDRASTTGESQGEAGQPLSRGLRVAVRSRLQRPGSEEFGSSPPQSRAQSGEWSPHQAAQRARLQHSGRERPPSGTAGSRGPGPCVGGALSQPRQEGGAGRPAPLPEEGPAGPQNRSRAW